MNQMNLDAIASWSTTTMGAAVIQTGAIRTRDFNTLSLFIKCSGTPTGTFKLQCSNDPGDQPTNWEDIASQTLAVAGAGGSKIFDLNCYWAWIRVVYTGDSGAGAVTFTNYMGKRYG